MTHLTIEPLLLNDPDIYHILTIIQTLPLKDAWLCAGSVRNFIWNHLTGNPSFDTTTDVDVIFFDPSLSYEATCQLEEKLKLTYPKYQWELKNQVYMHSHNPDTAPYLSAQDAMSKFPETATAIGICLNAEHQLVVYAPYGLKDLLAFEIRPTPYFLKTPERLAVFAKRAQTKTWQDKWPQITYPTLTND